MASERELLNMSYSTGNERLLFNAEGGAMYRPMNQLSDSEEADMDISGDEGSRDEHDQEPRAKRLRTSENQLAADDGDMAPRWSNPDPYTALPPGTVLTGKKKDVVGMIRKARVPVLDITQAVPAEAEEFIDFSDSDDDSPDHGSFKPPRVAPTGPRQVLLPTHFPSVASHNLPAKPSVVADVDKAREDKRPVVDPARHSESSTTGIYYTRMPPPPYEIRTIMDSSQYPSLLSESADVALGAQKRTHDDRIKSSKAGKRARPSQVAIKAEWRSTRGLDACPWIRTDHSETPVPTVRYDMQGHELLSLTRLT